MTGVAIATGLAAVGATIGAAMNAHAQKKANEANVDLMREQMAYQTSERLAAQQYNAPEAQRARFEAAGINPYFAMSKMDAGNTQAATGVTTPDIQPENYGDILSAATGGVKDVTSQIQAVQNIQAQNEAIKQAKVDTLYKERNVIADLRQKAADIALKMSSKDVNEQNRKVLEQQHKELEQQVKMATIDADYHEQMIRSRNSREENLARLAYEQQLGQHYQNEYQNMVNNAFPDLNAAQIQALKAQTAQSYAAANLSNKMSETEIEKKAGQITANQIATLEKQGWKKNYQAELSIKRANASYIRQATRKVRNSNNWVQNYSPLASMSATVGAAALK